MNKQPEIDSTPQNLICTRCGTAFSCGVAAGQADCWCFHLPRVHPVPASKAAGCWCPSCLQVALDEQAETSGGVV